MEIHKPKAAHSWREFVIEIGTIICGILIALGLEQVVEVLHRGEEVREAREALHREIEANARLAVAGLEADKCFRPQLDAFAAWAHGGARPTPLRVGFPALRVNTWETVKSGAVTHMPLQERIDLAALYDTIADAQTVINVQRIQSGVLVGVTEHDKLDAEDAKKVLDAVAIERGVTGVHIFDSKLLLRQAAGMGIASKPQIPADVRSLLDWECSGRGPNPLDAIQP